jgi:hypothetical protein
MSEREWSEDSWIDDVTQMMREAERDERERQDKRRARELFEAAGERVPQWCRE